MWQFRAGFPQRVSATPTLREAAWAASPPPPLLNQCWEWGGSRTAREGQAPAVPQVRTAPHQALSARALSGAFFFPRDPSSAASSASTAPFSLLPVFSRSLAPGRCVCLCLGILIIPPLFQPLIIVKLNSPTEKCISAHISLTGNYKVSSISPHLGGD